MYHDPIDYESIERRVVQRVQRRYRFILHTIFFAIGVFLIGSVSGSSMLFLVWVALWAMHLLWLNYQNHLEQALEREIEDERARVIKRKRDAGVIDDESEAIYYRPEHVNERPTWLGDDGEFADYDDQ